MKVKKVLIGEDVAKKLMKLLKKICKRTVIEAHKYLETHDELIGYNRYPIESYMPSKEEAAFKDVPYLVYDIQKYEIGNFPRTAKLYSVIFERKGVDCTKFEEFQEVFDYIDSNKRVKNIILEKNSSNLKFKLKIIITEIVERYLYSTNASKNIPEDLEEKLLPYILEKFVRYFAEELGVDILVPICLATFEEDSIKLSEKIEIVRMTEEIQKSRQYACTYEVSNEDWIAACATHMIVIHNCSLKNEENMSLNKVTRNYNAYPLQEIDNVMAAIRMVVGNNIGYEQILTRPIKWVDDFCADLIPLYGAKAHFVNPEEIEKFWLCLSISKIDREQSQKITSIYKDILKYKDEENSLAFALRRFNRCMLRNETDDKTTDATIGIEALLAGGTKGEITYTISNRIPVVFSYIDSDLYQKTNCRIIMKKIYNYRSKIVHGGTLKDKDKYYEIDGKKIEIAKAAVDFLKYTLLFMLEHPEFLDAKKFDEYIDSKV